MTKLPLWVSQAYEGDTILRCRSFQERDRLVRRNRQFECLLPQQYPHNKLLNIFT